MTDLLTRAWNILTPEQRPVGMELDCYYCRDGTADEALAYAAAYDRLCVACERVALDYGLELMHGNYGKYHWGYSDLTEGVWRERVCHTCRLTAAVLAIEAIKGGDK